MSQDCNVVCASCGVRGPDFGMGGFLGYPSLASDQGPAAQDQGDELVNCGYLLAAYEALGLETIGLQRFRSFLQVHAGHKMDIISEYSSSDDENLAPAVRDMLQREEERSEEEDFEASEVERALWRPPFGPEYVRAQLCVRCPACEVEVTSSGPHDWLRPRKKKHISPADSEVIVQRLWGEAHYNFYRVDTVLDPLEGLAPLEPFFAAHAGHGLEAWTVAVVGEEKAG